jgi:hypothetical protein
MNEREIKVADISQLNTLVKSNKKKKTVVKNGRKRSPKKWENHFKIAKKIFEGISDLDCGDDSLFKDVCISYRNPIVFDNNVSEASFLLPYHIPPCIEESMSYEEKDKRKKITKDHLIGMSNIVLYIYENKLYEKWDNVNDFINTLKSLQVLIKIPKTINDSKSFKSWQFDRNNINDCIYWNKKLKNENINYVLDKDNNQISVDDVWNEWYEKFKKYLK